MDLEIEFQKLRVLIIKTYVENDQHVMDEAIEKLEEIKELVGL